ncbi:MAG TPA: DddA-like double-stranded DNA deaminase toxin, partial [Pseudonocardiaceae bacterium]|nr:DddA-like double-stranded DNA deaminase toxin [Pseudonocardiaceae bacterium]
SPVQDAAPNCARSGRDADAGTCRRPAGCGRLLPVMLPDGCSLTVHAPGYRRRFTGGMTL